MPQIIRIGIVFIAFLGWIGFQMIVKKRKMAEMKSDVLTIFIFLFVLAGVFYAITKS
jgi:predicted tellurium resistance membrane protein TerC